MWRRRADDALFANRIVRTSRVVVDETRSAESVHDREEPACAVDEADDDGGVVGLSRSDIVRHVVRHNISGKHRMMINGVAVEILFFELRLDTGCVRGQVHAFLSNKEIGLIDPGSKSF